MGLVVQRLIGKHIQHRSCSPRFRLACTKHHTLETRMQRGPAAHGARLQGHIQSAVVQPVVAQSLCCSTHSIDLGMRRGVVACQRYVVRSGNHLPCPDHHSPHRHFACLGSSMCLAQGQLHETYVFRRMRHGCTMPSLTIQSAKACSSTEPCAYAACMAACDSGRCWLSLMAHCSSVMRSSNATMALSILLW